MKYIFCGIAIGIGISLVFDILNINEMIIC